MITGNNPHMLSGGGGGVCTMKVVRYSVTPIAQVYLGRRKGRR